MLYFYVGRIHTQLPPTLQLFLLSVVACCSAHGPRGSWGLGCVGSGCWLSVAVLPHDVLLDAGNNSDFGKPALSTLLGYGLVWVIREEHNPLCKEEDQSKK